MKKTTKGVLAAFAGGTLLLGGAGSLAFWTDNQTVPGTSIDSGHLTLSTIDCGDGWQLDGAAAGDTFDPATEKLVPGDVLTETCDTDLDLVGAHIGATLTLPALTSWDASSASDLTDELTPAVAFTVDGNPYTAPLEGEATYAIEAVVTVTYTGASATNDSEDLSALLDDLTIAATQDHV